MYKLILADDEADVREGVLQEINWAQAGFEVVDRAENGREALEMVERWSPDVLVTDIRMPFMDGLALAARVRDILPATKIIILTGYDEFEYARQAIRLNVEEFVLKPFSADDLLQALNKVRGLLDAQFAERDNMDSLREHYRRSLPLLRELFLGALMSRPPSERDILDKTQSYNLALPLEGRYEVAVIQPDLSPSDADHGIRSFAVRNIAEEIAEEEGDGACVFQHEGRIVLLAPHGHAFGVTGEPVESAADSLEEFIAPAVRGLDARSVSGLDSAPSRLLAMLEQIRHSVERYLKLTVTIGIGTTAARLRDAKFAYDDAVAALDYRILLGSNRLIPIADVESRADTPVRYDELQEQALVRGLKIGNQIELTDSLDRMFRTVMQSNPADTKQSVQLLLLQIVTALLKVAQDTGRDLMDLLDRQANLLQEINSLSNLGEAQEWASSICATVMSRIANERLSAYQSLVEQAKAYTKANFADSDLSINQVCAQLHISTGYFSSIFKKETKLTFVGYLLQLRMEAAKELLASTDLKAFEIAEQVGYSDPNYFSFSFKKFAGVSPKDYRARVRGEWQ